MKLLTRSTAPAALAVLVVITTAVGCNQTPTEITPLPRAVGEVEAVYFRAESLQPLDRANEGVYVLWALGERSEAFSLGTFFIDEITGDIVDQNGAPIESFRPEDGSLRNVVGILVTIEAPDSSGERPAGMQILQGTLIDQVATLSVPVSNQITAAAGSFRIFTPTDGPNTNENAGFWMADQDGNPSMFAPPTSAALQYETFIEIQGQNVNVGRFETPENGDDFCRFCAEVDGFEAPDVPGDDLLANSQLGLVLPADLSGAIVRVSLEGRFNDFAQQSQLVVLEAVLPLGLVGGETVTFVNTAGSFPTGRAVLY